MRIAIIFGEKYWHYFKVKTIPSCCIANSTGGNYCILIYFQVIQPFPFLVGIQVASCFCHFNNTAIEILEIHAYIGNFIYTYTVQLTPLISGMVEMEGRKKDYYLSFYTFFKFVLFNDDIILLQLKNKIKSIIRYFTPSYFP